MPFNVVQIRDLVKNAIIKSSSSRPQQTTFSNQHTASSDTHNTIKFKLVSESSSMKNLIDIADQVAPTGSSVLITGESGSGKEVLANYIHSKSSNSMNSFFALNCGAIPETLQESEFFGYKKGAFTGAFADKQGYFEMAKNGTLFMDEIGELTESMQVKLLRVLQEKKFLPVGGVANIKTNARIIAATNRDLREQIANGAFREDLFFRLNIFELHIPPLRDRSEDILPLARLFVKNQEEKLNKKLMLSKASENFLVNYSFPGNIRELGNIIERSAVLTSGDVISIDSAFFEGKRVSKNVNDQTDVFSLDKPVDLDAILAATEKKYISAALKKTLWNKQKTARILGISNRSLRYRLDKLNLSKNDPVD